MVEPTSHRRQLLLALAGITGSLAAVPLLATLTSPLGTDAPTQAILTLLSAAPSALFWLAAAWGFGIVLRRILSIDQSHSISLALGVAALLFLDSALGRLGWLQSAGGLGAWMVCAIGCFILLVHAWITHARSPNAVLPLPPAILWTAMPVFAAILLATTWAPGFLWQTEFGGYDVLSYHLQLPKEWLEHGRISPLPHNIYSFFPGAAESAFFHLAVLHNDALSAACSCQLLHACIGCATAACLCNLASRTLGPRAAPLAPLIFFWTPWVLVVASMAYNECFVLLALTAGWSCAQNRAIPPFRRGLITGFFAAAACASKLTAAGFVALPLLILLLTALPIRTWLLALCGCAAAGLLVLSPWLIHNFLASANPVFPFGHDLFSLGHWSAEQFILFHSAHSPAFSLGQRLLHSGQQLLWFGIGPNPAPPDPWLLQWGVTPVLVLVSLLAALGTRRFRPLLIMCVVLLVQYLFWITFTHIKSRFALPMLIPFALIIAFTISQTPLTRLQVSVSPLLRRTAFAMLALVLSCLTAFAYVREPAVRAGSAIGSADLLAGRNLPPADARSLAASLPSVYLNTQLPPRSKVLLVGESAPFYIDIPCAYNTTWDRSLLADHIAADPLHPNAWLRHLQDAGFTHLLLNQPMLDRWTRAGWNDPLLNSTNLAALTAALPPPVNFPGGISLLALHAVTERISSD